MNRTQVFLLVAFLSMASFYTWSKVKKLETTEREYQEARFYPEVEEKDVESIKVVSADPEFEYILRRRGDQWYIDSQLLSVEKTHQLVSSVLEISREREMDGAPSEERIEEFSLNKPAYQLTVIKNGGESLGTVKLGKRTPDYNHFYGQWGKGGSVSTVPAYTLGVLEDKPKDLRESSLLPVEVAAVDLFVVNDGKDDKIRLKRQEEELFKFELPEGPAADETKVKEFLNQLKDLKIARFLGDEEEAPSGEATVQFRALVSYSDFEIVTELQQRVPANRKLVYGRRYMREKDKTEPAENTIERFVIEIRDDGDVASPKPNYFYDRRVVVLNEFNDVEEIKIELDGKKLDFERSKHSKWKAGDKELPDGIVSALLFSLKELRFEEPDESLTEPTKAVLAIEIDGKSSIDATLRFGLPENGKPYLWRGSKGYRLSESSWKSIRESSQNVMSAVAE